MIQSQAHWHSLLRSLVIGGILFSPHAAIAQRIPIPDDTLGNEERSLVTPATPTIDLIEGGAQRGANLFHSFREFNVDTGRGVYFTNPAGVTNILTRVTGNNRSEIFGTLGVLGTANLFLLNPNGILFGPGAQLDIRGGSFIASTANSILFNNSFAFSATNPQAPPLLTVNVPIGLQYGSSPGAIQSQGALLQVRTGQTLTLAGGAVTVDGGALFAPGGRVELAGIGDAGEIGLAQQGREWRLTVPDGLTRSDVAIRNNAIVYVRSGGGGSIAITAQNLAIAGARTQVLAGIEENLGTIDAQAGDIDINTTEGANINESVVSNVVRPDGTGNAGNIRIATGRFSLTNGGIVDATTVGKGNAGNITITARDTVSLDGVGSNGVPSGAYSAVFSTANGQGGDINITAGSIYFTNGGIVVTSTLGRGDAGNATITARDTVSLDGVGSGVISSVLSIGDGQGGDISITTGKLSITNGAQVSASTFGKGDAGNATITARDTVSLDGVGNDVFPSGVSSSVESGANGQGGDINITTGRLSITNGAQVIAGTSSRGDAGNITIMARDAVSFDGVSSIGLSSGAFSLVNRGASGQGGDISITTGSLSFIRGGGVSASTGSEGDAGNITITARDRVSVDGVGSNEFASGAYSEVGSRAMGQGGDISILTGNLSLTNGGIITVSTFGQGDAGNITITARDAVSFDGVGNNGFRSGTFSTVGAGAIGQGGTIKVSTELFSIASGGVLTASSTGDGRAGNLDVNARQLRLDNQGTIAAQTASGQGGNITLQVQDLLLLRRGSSISTTAGTAQAGGDGGNITFRGNFIVAVDKENSDISANAFTGRGGRVEITAQGLFGIQFRPQLTPLSDITASSTFGTPGVVFINTPNVDPNRGLIQLPVDLSDASRLIVQTCPTGDSLAKQPNEFIITGRGGLPPTPSEAVDRDAIQVDLVTVEGEDQAFVSQNQPSPPPPRPTALAPHAPIVEAQAVQVAADGSVYLVAAASQTAIAQFRDRLIHCR